MGLFKKFKKIAKRAITGVATGGLSEVARAAGAKDLVKNVENLFVPTSLKQAVQTAAVIAPAFTGFVPGMGPRSPIATVDQSFSESPVAGTSGGTPMALGNVLGGLQGVLSEVSRFGGPAGTVATLGSGFLSGFLPAQGPMVGGSMPGQMPQAQMTMAAAPIIRGASAAVTTFVAPILAKMSMALGKNITLRAAMIIVRRLGKTLASPGAVAAAIGLSLSELSSLLTANAIKGSSGRKMNPGNVKALRRAHRRIKSFHKLCGDNDRLRAPRRRASPKIINVKGRVCD